VQKKRILRFRRKALSGVIPAVMKTSYITRYIKGISKPPAARQWHDLEQARKSRRCCRRA
jgi:hypothetical protein